jgi:hypothetical protein
MCWRVRYRCSPCIVSYMDCIVYVIYNTILDIIQYIEFWVRALSGGRMDRGLFLVNDAI